MQIDSISAPAHAARHPDPPGSSTRSRRSRPRGVFDGLRYRWRGDATELETIRALGQLYLAQGRYREALEALRSAGVRLPSLPEAQQLQADLNAAFRGLFLDGLADGLEPLQALALFFDFKELAPIGADGDLMVRKIVRRLVDVDLLPQAADLLKYQADNRLDGVPRAQVATDLAVIYLMDRKPEQALQAINASRTTVLPTALAAERRLIEARAWTGLGRYDSALEILGQRRLARTPATCGARSPGSRRTGPPPARCSRSRWASAGRPRPSCPATRKAACCAPASPTAWPATRRRWRRLQQRYQGFYEKANNPDALRIALSGVPTGRLSVADFGRVSADNEAFAGWVAKMKGRFKTRAAPPAPPSPSPRPNRPRRAPATPAAKG